MAQLFDTRILKDGWLKNYMVFTATQESPESFHLWTGMTIVSAAIRRQLWLDRGFYTLYPNLYVMLIAKSAQCRKTTAADIGHAIISRLGEFEILRNKMNLVKQKITPEGLLMKMQRVDISTDGIVRPDGSIFIYSPELKVFLPDTYATDLIAILTDYYTCPDEQDYTTRARETEHIKNSYIVFLGCSNPKWYAQCITEDAQAGGFTGRVTHVVEDRIIKRWRPEKDRDVEISLIHDLAYIGTMRGEMTLSREADNWLEDWYNNFEAPDDSGELDSFYARFHDHVLKTAMIMAISEDNSMHISLQNVRDALDLCERTAARAPEAFEFVGSTREAVLGDKFLNSLRKSQGWVQHSVLLRRMYKYVRNADEFSEIIMTLTAQEKVLMDTSLGPGGVFYALPEFKLSKTVIKDHKKRLGS